MTIARLLPALLVSAFALAPTPGCFTGHAENVAINRGFTFLGDRLVLGGNDHDVIGVGRADGRWHQIMIVVENAPVEIFNIVVTFGDGQRFEPGTRLTFGADTRSRTIDLPGGDRVIRRVDFFYGNLVAGAQAKVELWGR